MENTFFIIIIIMLSLSISAVTDAAAPPPSSRGGCTDQLILFSPCLSYVSFPPNNLTETASTKCCDAFSSSFAPNSLCFCYLLRDNHILGFPLNSTRLLSLSSLCLSPSPTTSSLNLLCAGSFFILYSLELMNRIEIELLLFDSHCYRITESSSSRQRRYSRDSDHSFRNRCFFYFLFCNFISLMIIILKINHHNLDKKKRLITIISY